MTRYVKRLQRGSVLVVSLVILLVLTVLGIAGVDTTMMQERMAGNLQESVSSFQAAEAGLRYGEIESRLDFSTRIDDITAFQSDCSGGTPETNGLCLPADPSTDSYDVWVSAASLVVWDPVSAASDVNTRTYGVMSASSQLAADAEFAQNVSRPPSWIIERLTVVERGTSIVVGRGSQQLKSKWYRITARGFGRNGQAQTTLQSVTRF